jgi:hypothetical protein
MAKLLSQNHEMHISIFKNNSFLKLLKNANEYKIEKYLHDNYKEN